jgi:acyl-CoA thioesterase
MDDAQDAANRASATMHSADHLSRHLGIEVEGCTPGASQLSMQVQDYMVNGHNICHGGVIFTLADTALAHASNSYNLRAVAAGCAIEFMAPAHLGDQLRASATELATAGRNGHYDVRVENQDGQLIALFRGRTRTVGGEVATS